MTLIKWKPQTHAFQNNLPHFIDSFFNDDFLRSSSRWNQASVNIAESEDGYRLEVAAPGFSKEDFKLEVEQNVLTISGEKKVEEKEVKENYTRKEFSYTNFNRSYTLPETVDADKIAATYENGILNVVIPKKEAAKKEDKKAITIA